MNAKLPDAKAQAIYRKAVASESLDDMREAGIALDAGGHHELATDLQTIILLRSEDS